MHDRATDTLERKLQEAKKLVQIGETYAHYKKAHQHYCVKDIALFEHDEEPCVVYQALYGEGLLWIRPLKNFLEDVEIQGKRISRFQKV